MRAPLITAWLILLVSSTAHSQAPVSDQAVLEIPDSLVIPGRTTWEQVTRGAKMSTYYGLAFPVERRDVVHPVAPLSELPPPPSKDVYPTIVRHGRARATRVEAVARHHGNVSAGANRLIDWNGYLTSANVEAGGGAGHTSGAAWYDMSGEALTQRVVSWRSAYDGGVSLRLARSGVWGMQETSHRSVYVVGANGGSNLTLFGDNQFATTVAVRQRGVSAPDNSASEQLLTGHVGWQRVNGRFWVKGHFDGDLLHTSRDAGVEGFAKIVSVGAEAWTRLEENFGGAMGVTFHSVDHLQGDSLRTARLSLASWFSYRPVKFTARLTSGVERYGIWDAYNANRMLNVGTPLRMPFRSVDLDLKASISLGSWNAVTAGLRDVLYEDYPIWRREAPGQPYVLIPQSDTTDARAKMTSLYGRYYHQLSEGRSIDLLAIWRTHSLEGSTEPVPFMPDWEAHLAFEQPVRWNVTLRPSVEVMGPRSYVDVDQSGAGPTAELEPFVLVNIDASMPARRGWDVTFAVRNILNSNHERLDGVAEPGIHFMLGARKAW